jgi:hypothetical protein
MAVLFGFVPRILVWKEISQAVRSALPVIIFAVILILLQWISRMPLSPLPLRLLAVFFFTTLACRVVPWTDLIWHARPGSTLQMSTLFALFVRHFVRIFSSEARRVLQARALCVRRPYGRGAFPSLVWALAAFLGRSIVRAERFYAAQYLRGWSK